MKKLKSKFTLLSERLYRFWRVNLFVQQFRYKAFKWWYWIDLSASIVERARPIFDTFMMGLVINEVQLYVTQKTTSLNNLYTYIILTLVVRLIVSLYVNFYYRFDWYFANFGMTATIESEFMRKLMYLNWEHIENPKMEKKINMTFNRSLEYMRRLAELHVDVIVAIITLVSTFALITAPVWVLAVTILKELPSVILTAWGAKLSNKVNDETTYEFIKKGTIFGYFRDFSVLSEIKISRGHSFLQQVYDDLTKTIRSKFMEKDKKLLLPWSLTLTYETLLNGGVYVYYIAQVLFNGMLLGTFQYTTNLINQWGVNIYRLITKLSNSVDYYRYVSYAHDLMALQNERPDGKKILNTDKIVIEFRNVWFKYPGAKRYSLKDVSFTIEDNERLAIVGENGAGKTTFLKLLNRLYVPTKGSILVNGIPTSEYTADSYNSKISVVTQDFARYGSLPVAQNIAIYDKDLTVDLPRVKKAAQLADADRFIEKLPKGYDTFLTKRLEDGTELSTGQWQRIAVARQFYANRPLVVLDEPTSAIDPIAEAKIFTNLYEHVKDKTVIVVSHRYNTVRAAKKILVFNGGQIIEQGTHEELVALNGYYAKAFDVQQTQKKL